MAPLHRTLGNRVTQTFPSIGNLQVVWIARTSTVPAMLQAYQQSGLVEYAEPDFIVCIPEIDCSTIPLPRCEAWIPAAAPPANLAINLRTIGGVTYATHTGELPACHQVQSRVAGTAETGFSQIFYPLEWSAGCENGASTNFQGTAILGRLPPGEHMFTVKVWDAFLGSEVVVAVIPFAVPANALSLAAPIGRATDPFRLRLEGVEGVAYAVEASTDLVTWAAVATNLAGSFTFTDPDSIQLSRRFYRVRAKSADPSLP